jgi:hydroxymethylglutaryl-CoA reductase
MNFISLLNSLSSYLLIICRFSAFIGFFLPLYFIIPVVYIMDRTQNLERAVEKLLSYRDKNTKNIKIKNCISFIRVPLGLASPLTIHGESKRTVYALLATVEPTLVASCSRGYKTFQATSSIQVTTLSEGLSRVPVFIFRTVNNTLQFYYRMPTLKHLFDASNNKTSRYTCFIEITPHIISRTIHVKFQYICGDTARQNIITITTYRAC